jgi:L-iditol 2-dehydrogenase
MPMPSKRTYTDLPKVMRAVVYRGRGKVRVEHVPVPSLKKGEVLVRIEACGVCPSDLKKIEYGTQEPPRIYGHEMAGVIVRIASGVQGWQMGERVAVMHHIPCGDCYYCHHRDYAQCPVYKATGTTAGWEPAGGGFAEYVRVLPWIVKKGMVRIPKKVSFDEASFIEPLNTCLKGVERLSLMKGDTVLVFGQGPIGIIFNQILSARGIRVLGLDLLAGRRDLGDRLGADWVGDPRSDGLQKTLRKLTGGRGADAAILTISAAAAVDQAMSLIRPGGRVLLFAHTRKNEFLRLDGGSICVDEKTMLGSYSASIDLQEASARLIFSRRVKVLPLVSHRFPLKKTKEAFALASHPDARSLKVIIHPHE